MTAPGDHNASLQGVGTVTMQHAKQLSRTKRLDLLMQYNGMTEPVVHGIATRRDGERGPTYWIVHLETLEGSHLKLPLSGSFPDPRIPFKPTGDVGEGDLVAQRIAVVPDNHREILVKDKPFAMIAIGPAVVLSPLSGNAVARDKKGRVLIRASVMEAELKAIAQPLEQAKHRLEIEMAAATAASKQKLDRLTKELDDKKAFLLSLNDAVDQTDKERIAVEKLRENASRELIALSRERVAFMAAYQQMTEFAQARATILLSLDLISDEQYCRLSGQSEVRTEDGSLLSWQDDLGMDYRRAVSAIHAYLLSQGIIYPRWLVGNFLTLLRTNDLVILSGLSGAGKTQIVRSFAEALGGVAHVMPVKPNWTGAEDLLGFFNPLQRSYVRTPFLEALLDAARDPERLHLICLDEMNLARAEYYFADFLSALEDRSRLAEVPLYSESEASHIQAEVRILLAAATSSGLAATGAEGQPRTLAEMLQRPDVMEKVRSMFGESAAESFPAFHGRVRRALSTVLDIPSRVTVPSNVRFIGAINVDQTTYGLSPKILDRAHVLRFENPLKYSISAIREEAARHTPELPRVAPLYMPPAAFMPQRTNYPEYDETHPAAVWLLSIYNDFLSPLGMDVAYRTIRQAQQYWDLLKEVTDGDETTQTAIAQNLIVLQKVLPKFTIDGKVKAKFRQEPTPKERWDIVREMEETVRETAKVAGMHPNMQEELHRVRMAAEANDKIFNYWA